jgi:hypothetical protein
MRSNRRASALVVLLASGLFAAGCARGPDVQVNGLGLRRVVIYRNGVGYFERAGKVDSDEVAFRVRKERVGDFLATLAVIEQGGSSVRSASFPVKLAGRPDEDASSDDADAPPAVDPRYALPFQAPLPPKPKRPKSDGLETVKLMLDGKEHDLAVGYVAETPVWRPSYRLVIADKKADLQAWGIIQNLSGEDWKQVQLSLVAGAPLAFQATLEKAVVPERPIVSDAGEVIAGVPIGETSLANEPIAPPMPAAAPAAEAEEEYGHALGDMPGDGEKDSAVMGSVGRLAGKGGGRFAAKKASPRAEAGGMPAAPMARQAAPAMAPPQNPSRPRNMSALAGVALEGGTTRYDLPFPVDVPDKNATMVLLLSQEVPGEALYLFAPDGGVPDSRFHPFRVARFVNNTKGLLEKGPIAVFESGAFLGQGMVDPLPPGASATVPFALERSIAIELSRTDNQESARLARIEAGTIEIERDGVTHSKYTIKNGSADLTKVLVKHLRSPGTRLFQPPKGTEDNVGTGSALVPSEVASHSVVVLDVDERRAFRQSIDALQPLADEAVRAYLADPRADVAVVGPLRGAWELRGKLRSGWDEHDTLNAEKNHLDGESEQLRRDLRAIEKDVTAEKLRKELTDRLSKASARLSDITKRLIELDTSIREQAIRFRDVMNVIKLTKPLSPPT